MVPAGELTASFHWLAARVAHAATRAPATLAEPDAEEVLGRMASRNRVSGYAAAVFETVTVAELEEIEDQLFRFARTVESNRRLADRPRRPRPARDRPPAGHRPAARGPGAAGHRPAGRLRRRGAAGPGTSWPRSTPWSRTRPGPGAGGWPGSRRPTRWTRTSASRLSEALGVLAGNPVDLQVTIDPAAAGRRGGPGRRPAGRQQHPPPARRTEGAPPRLRGGLPHSRRKGTNRWLS